MHLVFTLVEVSIGVRHTIKKLTVIFKRKSKNNNIIFDQYLLNPYK